VRCNVNRISPSGTFSNAREMAAFLWAIAQHVALPAV